MKLPTPELSYSDIKVGRLYLPEQVLSLLGFTSLETLYRRRYIEALGPIKLGGRRMYPGERLIRYFESLGWEQPVRKPLTKAQVRRRVADSTRRALSAV